MATRRRTSLEAREVNALPMKAGKLPFTQEAYDDFRRRHSRQNKEIIAENALRKTTINALQTEITNLHNEVLAIRRANLHLHAQVRRAKTEQSSVLGKAATEVLDQLLSAMPMLQQLRDQIVSAPAETKPPPTSRQFTLRSTENPVATRPAASGAVNVVLGGLAEASEDGYETTAIPLDNPVTIVLSQNVRRQSGLMAGTTPRISISGQNLQPEGESRPISAFPNSPSVTSFPRSPSLVRFAGRRRESGHFVLPPKTLFPSHDASADTTAEPFGGVEVSTSGVTARRKGRISSAITAGKIREVVIGLNSDSEASPSPPPEVEAEQIATEPSAPAVQFDGEISNKRNLSSNASSSAAPHPEILENGLRERRVRSSVNYKEPSLTKKMRKPDGLSLEETLKVSSSRQSLDIQASHDVVGSTPQHVIGSTSTRIGDLRRKSVLPKSGLHHGYVKEEETDEEEVDSFLDLAMGGMELDEEDFACGSPDTRPPAGVSVSTLAPPKEGQRPTITPRKSPSRPAGTFKASSGRPGTRASPRKKPIGSSKRPVSLSPPEMPRSQVTQKAKPRDALSNMDFNPKISASTAKSMTVRKSAVSKDTSKASARRRLTSLA